MQNPGQAMPPKKRKSGEGAAPKGKAAKKDDLMPAIKPDSMRMPHMKIFDAWMRLGLVRVTRHSARKENVETKSLVWDEFLTKALADKD